MDLIKLIDQNVECVDTPNGKYLNRSQVFQVVEKFTSTNSTIRVNCKIHGNNIHAFVVPVKDGLHSVFCCSCITESENAFAKLASNGIDPISFFKLSQKQPEPERFYGFYIGQKVMWGDLVYYVMEDNGEPKVLITNSEDIHDDECNDCWVYRHELKAF